MPKSHGGGDSLARGAVRYTFSPAEVTQQRWNDIFGENSGPKKNYSDNVDKKPVKIRKSSNLSSRDHK